MAWFELARAQGAPWHDAVEARARAAHVEACAGQGGGIVLMRLVHGQRGTSANWRRRDEALWQERQPRATRGW
jgi:hypothetical protein